MDRDHSSVLIRFGKQMGAENRVEDTGEEGNRSLGKVLRCPIRYTVRAPSLADLETPDGLDPSAPQRTVNKRS